MWRTQDCPTVEKRTAPSYCLFASTYLSARIVDRKPPFINFQVKSAQSDMSVSWFRSEECQSDTICRTAAGSARRPSSRKWADHYLFTALACSLDPITVQYWQAVNREEFIFDRIVSVQVTLPSQGERERRRANDVSVPRNNFITYICRHTSDWPSSLYWKATEWRAS